MGVCSMEEAPELPAPRAVRPPTSTRTRTVAQAPLLACALLRSTPSSRLTSAAHAHGPARPPALPRPRLGSLVGMEKVGQLPHTPLIQSAVLGVREYKASCDVCVCEDKLESLPLQRCNKLASSCTRRSSSVRSCGGGLTTGYRKLEIKGLVSSQSALTGLGKVGQLTHPPLIPSAVLWGREGTLRHEGGIMQVVFVCVC